MSDSVTCARLILGNQKPLFVKSNWFPDHFSLVAFDGQNSWSLQASEEQIAGRAEGWDKTVSEYMEICRRHLGQSSPASNYQFSEERDGAKLSFETKDTYGTILRGIWRLHKDANSGQGVSDILNCLVDRNEALEERAVKSKRDFDRMKDVAEKSQQQTERYKNAKKEFEDEIYKKFVAVLNSKKAKLREERDASGRNTSSCPKATATQKEEDMEGDETEREDEGTGSDMEGEAASGGSPVFTSQDFYSNPLHLEPANANATVAATDPPIADQAQGMGRDEAAHQSASKSSDGTDQATVADAKRMAAALLSTASDYTSAPRRRRRL